MTVFPILASRRSLLGALAPAAAGMAALPRPDAVAGGGSAGVVLFVAFDVLDDGKPELHGLLRLLADRATATTGAGFAVAVGATLLDWLGLQRPRPGHRAPATAAGPDPWHGDLLLRIEAEAQAPAVAALCDVVRRAQHLMAPRWKVNGFRQPGAGSAPPREAGWRRGGSAVEILKVRHLVERGEATASVGERGDLHERFAYDHGIDAAGQLDMGHIACRYLAEPDALPSLAVHPGGPCCGGGLFFALPRVWEMAAA